MRLAPRPFRRSPFQSRSDHLALAVSVRRRGVGDKKKGWARAPPEFWASAGNTDAKFRAGMMHLLGEGGPRNMSSALAYFDKSARQYLPPRSI